MKLRIAAAALAIGLCTAGVASADEVPPEFQNRPTIADCYNAVPTIVGSGFISGTMLDDVIRGSEYPDVIDASDGDDIILGLGRDDVIFGGDGNDLICAGWGEDRVQGGPGHDTVYGELGNDRMRGGDGRDLLSGDLNFDEGDGEAGFDFCPASTEVQVSC
ncbi:hypothetical protein LFM09_16205 [Lentzea alba]|uniref:calcium-binding protein n=1 Tax=Lentzea alba TaxID=2714351 RepID=UPI0039BFB3FD